MQNKVNLDAELFFSNFKCAFTSAEKSSQKFTEINPILVTFGSSKVLNEIFLRSTPRHAFCVNTPERAEGRVMPSLQTTFFVLGRMLISSMKGVVEVVCKYKWFKWFNNCMKLSERLRPAGLPTVIITVLKSRAKLEKRLITGDNDGHYDKLCLFQLWRAAHVLLCKPGLIKYILLTNRVWFILLKIKIFFLY